MKYEHKPLEGVVRDRLYPSYSGPYCTLMLADLALKSLKLNAKELGDDSRHFLRCGWQRKRIFYVSEQD